MPIPTHAPSGSTAATTARPDRDAAALVAAAQQVLRDFAGGRISSPNIDVIALFELAMRLRAAYRFRYARQLLSLARRGNVPAHPEHGLDDARFARVLRQQHAHCTYKDPDLPADLRLDRALAILADGEDLATTTDPDTLTLAGASWKRKWELESDRAHLERALSYYERSHHAASAQQGFVAALTAAHAAVNVAFVLDLLAAERPDRDRHDGTGAATARADVCRMLRPYFEQPDRIPDTDRWWFHLTFAEAALGLDRYDDAAIALARAREAPHDRWQYESSTRQLAAVARSRMSAADATDYTSIPAWRVLREFLGEDAPGLLGTFTGKVGLALSGGGLRASFFHIGVLAKLAELGVLPFVEVLSCVSGGSIVGAQYYLELRTLFGAKHDREIVAQDYVDVVWRIHEEFLAGVQHNIRTRMLAELTTSLKMIALPHYTRTRRLGELYEKLLYSRVADGEGDDDRWLSALYVQPRGDTGFNPKWDNWRRANKVPMLVLNATTLNTGHNWQFTASWMGEPPSALASEIDANGRLRRMYYEEAPQPYKYVPGSRSARGVRLGHAVAASSCVPGIFEPLALPRLYPGRVVRLVDGGVYDNQGTASLLEQDCTVVLVSDASGQMESATRPAGGAVDVMMRASSVLMDRVRAAEYREMTTRLRASFLHGMMFLHLKKGLGAPAVSWIDCQEPPDLDDASPATADGLTDYGILARIQTLLASVRTDLDSFSDAEAYALMLSGYDMAAREFTHRLPNFPAPVPPPVRPPWRFLALANDVAGVEPMILPAGGLEKQLGVSARQFFKGFRRASWQLVGALGLTAAIVVALGLAALAVHRLGVVVPSTALGLSWTVPALLTAWGLVRVAVFKESSTQVLTGMMLGIVGIVLWPVNRLHLHVFDRAYLRSGRVRAEAPSRDAASAGTATVSE